MTPPYRWSFGLRSLFVLTAVLALPLGWIGWQYHAVRQRNEVIRLVQAAGGYAVVSSCFSRPTLRTELLGDSHADRFRVPPGTPQSIRQRIAESFPEAEITPLFEVEVMPPPSHFKNLENAPHDEADRLIEIVR